MPLLWRYILGGYLKVFCLSVSTFIAVLIVSRFKEIARFAALTGDLAKTGIFILYQIPLILPIAILVSALLASLLLFQRLSRTFELTALRSAGISLTSLLAPILLASSLLGLANFILTAELSPFCRRESKALLFHETSTNPLLLLQRQNFEKLKHAYLNMTVKEEGKSAKDLVLIAYNENNQRLSLLTAKRLRVTGNELLGKEVAIVSHVPAETVNSFDPLVIENQSSMSTEAPLLSQSLKKKRPRLDLNSLSLQMLRIRQQDLPHLTPKIFTEIGRRATLALAVVSFTLLGCAFGIEQGRNPSKKNLLALLLLAMPLLLSYFLSKEFKTHLLLSSLVFLFPHLLIWVSSILRLLRISRGAL